MNRGLEFLGDDMYVKLQLAIGFGQMSSSVYSRCSIDVVENFQQTEEYAILTFMKQDSRITN